MKSYYRIMLGKKSIYAEEAHKWNYIWADWFPNIDLTGKFPDNRRDFNKEFIPLYIKEYPGSSKVGAGLWCGFLRTICKWILKWDIILSPNWSGAYLVWEVVDDYSYHKGENLCHRRIVNRYPKTIERSDMSQALQNSTWAIWTVSNITKYAEEIELLISNNRPATIISTDENVEDPSTFALEKHLEDFLVANWSSTELWKKYNIFEVDWELVWQQYPSDTWPIDILAISKDKKEILVIELKKWRVSDVVVWQIQRYMWYVQEELAEPGQKVMGIIIWLDDDIRIRRALKVTNNIEFYRYQISFKLTKEM